MNTVFEGIGKVTGAISRHDWAALTTAPLMGPLPTTADGDKVYSVRLGRD